jgi:ribonucleoside-diphosphate reductase alpha chain
MESGLTGNCSELILSPLDSCRLLLLNLYSFVKNPFTKDAQFDFELFAKYSQYAQRLMDDLVDLEAEKIRKILQKIENDPEPMYTKCRELDMWKRILKYCFSMDSKELKNS